MPSTCVLGTESCLYSFSSIDLFSIPELGEISAIPSTSCGSSQTELTLLVTDGISNPFDSSSILWEVYPDDAAIIPGSCTAVLEPGYNTEYTIFASGHGKLNEVGCQFKNITITDTGEGYFDYVYENETYCYTYSMASEFYIRTEKSTGVKILSYAPSGADIEVFDISTPNAYFMYWITDSETGLLLHTSGPVGFCLPSIDCFGPDTGSCWFDWDGAEYHTEQECDSYLRSFLPEAIQNYQFPVYCNTWWSHVDGDGLTQTCSQ